MTEKILYYQVKFTYKDGKEVNLNIQEEKLSSLFAELCNKKIYWSNEEEPVDNGFWTDLDGVRFVQINIIKEETNENTSKDQSSDTELCAEEYSDTKCET